MSAQLERLEWLHPVLGEVSETVCPPHRASVMGSLRELGIGCVGFPEPKRHACDRCLNDGERPRKWLPGRLR